MGALDPPGSNHDLAAKTSLEPAEAIVLGAFAAGAPIQRMLGARQRGMIEPHRSYRLAPRERAHRIASYWSNAVAPRTGCSEADAPKS